MPRMRTAVWPLFSSMPELPLPEMTLRAAAVAPPMVAARPTLIPFELPTRAELQQQLFVQQMGVYAKSYLRDLRRDAVVETRT